MTRKNLKSQDMGLCIHGMVFRVINDNPQAMQEAFRLRYVVYCKEKKFLPASQYPDGLETDKYDDNAIHIGAFNEEGALVGYARMVLPHWKARFPMHQHCSFYPAHRTFSNARYLKQEHCAEVSRIVVRRDVRAQEQGRFLKFCRRYLRRTKLYKFSRMLQSLTSGRICVALGLYKMILFVAAQENINYLFASIEQCYSQALKRHNINFQQVGPMVDYYGPVAPYVIDARDAHKSLCRNNPFLRWYLSRYIKTVPQRNQQAGSVAAVA